MDEGSSTGPCSPVSILLDLKLRPVKNKMGFVHCACVCCKYNHWASHLPPPFSSMLPEKGSH